MSLKRLCQQLPDLSSLVVGPLVEGTCQLCLFFEQRSKIYSKRISTVVKTRVHELHIFPSFLFCLLDFFLAVDLSLAGKSPSLFKYLNFCCGIATGLYEGQSKSPSQQIILQTLLRHSLRMASAVPYEDDSSNLVPSPCHHTTAVRVHSYTGGGRLSGEFSSPRTT